MSNTRKLVYLLPEVCFIAELVPHKKPHSFSIQSFRQINGQFMEDEELVTENVIKLFNKIDPGKYTIVLPDFLFTNTIIDVAESTEQGVRAYLLNNLLPSLGLSKDAYQLETFILTQHQNKTKVQLSGLEKSILSPVYDLAAERGIEIETICPLSWTLKSVITLEPSLSAVELGKHIYVAQHYIGVDQSVFFSNTELGNLVESVRTLRGAEPNLQTFYLLTSPDTERNIREQLKQKLPLQQLAEMETSIEGLPAHVKTAIEAAAKTLDIEDYPVPRFSLVKYEEAATKTASAPVQVATSVIDEEKVVSKPLSLEDDHAQTLPTPKPHMIEEAIDDNDDQVLVAPSLPQAATPISAVAPAVLTPTPVLTSPASAPVLRTPPSPTRVSETTQFVDKSAAPFTEAEVPVLSQQESNDWLSDTEELQDDDEEENSLPQMPSNQSSPAPTPKQRPIIKNRNTNGSLFKMVGITLGALLVTVVVGVGIGFVLLKTAEKDSPVNQGLTPTPKASSVAKATPTVAATASPSASVVPVSSTRDKLKILVVNATGVSGLAGKMKTTLTQAGYKTVDTANAKGKYEKGYVVLFKTPNSELLAQLEKDSKVKVTAGDQDIKVEDSASSYDAVFVINE